MNETTIEQLFKKLGEAIYTHKTQIKKAKEASESVTYFEKKGLFSADKAED